MNSHDYWKKRESENLKHNLKTEEEYAKTIGSYYDYMMDQCQKEINGFYTKYARAEGITLAEAKRRVSKLDIEAYGRKAARYVQNKDLSDQANEEMRLYNATMKINRLEMLKANIGLELVDGFDELQKFFGEKLTDRTLSEFERMAGILGATIENSSKKAEAIVNASFNNAKYSDRIWMYQDMMKAELSKLLQTGLIQGRNPRQLATHLQKLFGVQKSNAERLMRTELARVQIEAQKQSFERNGFTKYEFIALGNACEICRAIDGKHFDVAKMMPGENAPPMHPNCVLPDTKITAPDMEAMMRSTYSGNIVEIGTSNGTRLSVTPNHIVLTARGWVRAKNLVQGDKVVYYGRRTESMIEANPADNNGVVTAEQLFATLIKASSVSPSSVPVSAEDFKGDAVADSEVDVVFIDSKLREELDSSAKKLISDVSLIRTSIGCKRILPTDCTLAQLLVGVSLASDGIMSGKRIASILLRGALTHSELVSLRLPSDYNSRLSKTASNNTSADVKMFGNGVFTHSGRIHRSNFGNIERYFKPLQSDAATFETAFDSGFCDPVGLTDLLSAFSGFIAFDDIVFVTNKFYSGHVYDASSLSTLYISNGIITSNCRCSVAAWEDDKDYEEWLDYLDKGGTTEEWNQLKKKREKSIMEPEDRGDLHISLNQLSDNLSERSLQVNNYLNTLGLPESKWSGRTIVKENETMGTSIGKKVKSCDIWLREDATTKTIIHEHLHARSISRNPDIYGKYHIIEEATVELLSEEICKRNKIPFTKSYIQETKALRDIADALGYKELYSFSKELAAVDADKRKEWINTTIERYQAKHKIKGKWKAGIFDTSKSILFGDE